MGRRVGDFFNDPKNMYFNTQNIYILCTEEKIEIPLIFISYFLDELPSQDFKKWVLTPEPFFMKRV